MAWGGNMNAREWDINLELPLGAELYLSIDANQFSEDDEWDENLLPREDWECRFYEKREAMEITQQIANMLGHSVELDVYSITGQCRQLVDMVMIKPEVRV